MASSRLLDSDPVTHPTRVVVLRAFLPLVALLVLLTGCDSGEPVDHDSPEAVAGIYTFTRFTFDPDGQGIDNADVLDTLVAGSTELRLSGDGEFRLDYAIVGGSFYFMSGAFTVTPTTVTLNGESNDRAKFERLLLDTGFTLLRDPADADVLTAEIQKRVNLEAFSEARYAGLTSVPGVLRLALERQ